MVDVGWWHSGCLAKRLWGPCMVHVALSLEIGKPSPRDRVLYPSKVAFRGRQSLVSGFYALFFFRRRKGKGVTTHIRGSPKTANRLASVLSARHERGWIDRTGLNWTLVPGVMRSLLCTEA